MDCNLELGLSPSSTSLSSSASTISMGFINGDNPKQEQMTIFYNGRICVCDVTEVQARSIIQLASRKTAQGMCTSPPTREADTISPTLQSQQLCTQTQNGLSMKKSLRQFLEKRKHRIQATSPYHR